MPLRKTLRLCALAAVSLALFAQDAGRGAPQTPPPGGGRGRGGGGGRGPGQLPIEETGFLKMFDGETLKGWDCDPDFWRVDGGIMTAETKPGHMPKQNTFCVWRGSVGGDFDLKLQYKLTGTGANSGVQYRSVELPEVARWVLKGYQADIDADERYTGQVYEERGRGFLANRGNFAYVADGQKSAMVGTVGDGNELKAFIKSGDWNDIEIVARGNTIVQLINGHVMAMLIDDDKANRKLDGLIGIQLHVTQAGEKVEAKNIRIKPL